MRRCWLRALGAIVLLHATLGSAAAAQQTGAIVAQVVDSVSGSPIRGAQVHVAGTDIGGLTNDEGRVLFAAVPAGARTVRVQLMGYASREQTVTVVGGGTATVVLRVKQEAIALQGLVVTALGIERSERSLGYAVQSMNSVALERSPEVTLVSALSAQAAGVSVTTASGRPGASARIVIRGETSFSGSGQPLFVVDGVPISIDLDTQARTNSVLAPEQLDYGEAGSRMMDLDPNSIEEISVLRGAAATALYGSRAAGGAVIIKTKQGRAGPTRYTFSSRIGFDRPIIEGYITDWAAGDQGYYCNGKLPGQGGWCQPGFPSNNPSPTTGLNWGPHKDSIPQIVLDSVGEVRFRDARADFYRTGRVLENSLNATGSVPGGHFNLGISHVDQKGIVPASKLDRLNMSGNITLNLSGSLRSNTSILFSNTENDWQYEGWFGVGRTLTNLPPSRDIRQAWNEDGTPVLWASNTPHPEWVVENEFTGSTTRRWIASQGLTFTVIPGLHLGNRIGLDSYLDQRQRYQNERPWRTSAGLPSGGTDQQKIERQIINNDLTVTVDPRQLGGGFAFGALLGSNLYMEESSDLRARGSDVNIPGFYNISNFSTQIVTGNLPTKRRLVGVYSQATIDYRNWAFLTLTGRNDWSSTLPSNNNSYFYPSASLGIVFTDALGWASDLLPYGKLRISLSKVGNDAPPYRLSTRYQVAQGVGADNGIQQFNGPPARFPFRGQNGYLQGNELGNPDLKPESTREWEAGVELRLLQDRARLDVSYYDKSSYDQIFSVPSSPASGFTSITRNAGDLRNSGFEVSVQARPIEMAGFAWDVRANWSRNRSEVIRLATGVTALYLAGYDWPSIQILPGYGYGVIWGYGWQRDEQGQLLIGDDGFPLLSTDFLPLGSIQPDWLGNLNTSLTYRGIGLSALLDVRQGGNIINFETNYTANSGRSILTATRGTPYTFEGVNVNTGQPNQVVLIRDRTFFNRIYGFDRHESQIEDGSYVKLREVTLSYVIPRSLLERAGIESATLFATGRNLRVWSDFTLGDPEGSNYGSSNAGGGAFRFFTLPQTRSWTMGVRAAF
jgi:TonB-linked SusC/RagA family outer membrane protein